MKIVVAAASFASTISGVQRHAFNMVRCLLSHPDILEVHLVVAPWQLSMTQGAFTQSDSRLRTHVASMAQTSLSRNYWYYRELPTLAATVNADLVHFTCPMPLHACAFNCPTVVTLHDLYPYEIPMNFGFPKFIFNRAVLQQCLRSADAIACVSEATCNLLRWYTPPSVWRKALRIYNCVEPETQESDRSPIPGWTGEPFLLCIAQHRRNKNIPLLLRAFVFLLQSRQIAPNTKLVVVGMRGPESRKIDRLISASGCAQSIYLLEGLPEQELQWCYRHCEALTAPSITEGFGLPIAEGLLAGCRIVCSDIPAHREIGGAHCRYVALRRDAAPALANAITETLHEPTRQPAQLPQLAVPVLAKQYIALYRRLIASAASLHNLSARSSAGSQTTGQASASTVDRRPALQFKVK